MANFLTKIFGTHSSHELKKIYPIADKVDALEEQFKKLTDDEREAMGIENIPDNLDRAVRAMKKDSLIHRTLGSHAFMKYVAYKQKEWNQYRNVVTEWEIKNYLSRY